MDIKEMSYCPVKIVPLVPDLSPAEKAMIHEELTKSLLMAESATLGGKMHSSAAAVESVQAGQVELLADAARSESKRQKLGRRLKGLFMNDQTKTPSRKHSLDVRHDDALEDDDLYHFDGRSKHLWGGSGL